jgi:hypothetical protein
MKQLIERILHDEPVPAIDPNGLPSCPCGTRRIDRAATPEREYTTRGMLYLLWGGTSVPSRVRFRCVHCGEVFDECVGRKMCLAYTT